MAKESEFARELREELEQTFPGKRMLNYSEVGKFCKIDPRTAKAIFPFRNGYISSVVLCNEMGQTNGEK